MANSVSSDAQANKVMAILGYVLFLIPLLAAPKSPFAKYHANQGLLLLIFSIAVNIIGSAVPVIGLIILPVGGIASLVFFIMGIMNAANGAMKPLPVIGNFTLIK